MVRLSLNIWRQSSCYADVNNKGRSFLSAILVGNKQRLWLDGCLLLRSWVLQGCKKSFYRIPKVIVNQGELIS